MYEEIVQFLEEQGMSMLKLCSVIDNYRTSKYSYESKNIRIAELNSYGISNEVIAIDVLTAVISVNKEPQTIQSVVAKLADDYMDIFSDTLSCLKTMSELLAVCSVCNLYTIERKGINESYSVQSRVVLENKTIDKINKFKYLPPMVCKPNVLTSNINTSHLTIKKSVILGKANYHEKKQAIDVINIANSVKLSLDPRILEFEETPNKELDTIQKKQQFSELNRTSTEVYNEIMELGNEFYLTWNFDKRGRTYSDGYHINIQSTGYKKACINLAKKEIINV